MGLASSVGVWPFLSVCHLEQAQNATVNSASTNVHDVDQELIVLKRDYDLSLQRESAYKETAKRCKICKCRKKAKHHDFLHYAALS